MTTIRNKKDLRRYVNRAPDDRLRNSAGMGLGEPERQPSVFWPALLLIVLLAAYAMPDIYALILVCLAVCICGLAIAIYRFYVNPALNDVAHMKFDENGDPAEQADADYRGWKPRGNK